MIKSVLVVCIGNICRSPVGERALQAELDRNGANIKVTSAGLHALVGNPADGLATEVAKENGVTLTDHIARQFTHELGQDVDLILVMEPGHKAEVTRLAPTLSGRTLLFDQWTGSKGISDPYRRSREFHEAVFKQIQEASQAWAKKLTASKSRRP